MAKILPAEDGDLIKAVSPDRSDQPLVLVGNSNSDITMMYFAQHWQGLPCPSGVVRHRRVFLQR
jgi:hypothetical protein